MIGKKIRELRKHHHLSINELAVKVGVSDSYISQLERNIVDPSVSVLRKIAGVFRVPIASFFDEEYEPPVVIRNTQRIPHPFSEKELILTRVSPAFSENDCGMEVQQFELCSKNQAVALKHEGETCIHVLHGTIEITVNEQTHPLQAGDSLYVTSFVPYMLFNPGTVPAGGFICSTGNIRKEESL